ncbi:hypothetical protein [Falsiroseomonas sp. CW058]|uniref:hypothetical protein n=1 Tax=Falsiroseomonas sp. CW058 TaxID=3388664 RepID=UPI003D31552E
MTAPDSPAGTLPGDRPFDGWVEVDQAVLLRVLATIDAFGEGAGADAAIRDAEEPPEA